MIPRKNIMWLWIISTLSLYLFSCGKKETYNLSTTDSLQIKADSTLKANAELTKQNSQSVEEPYQEVVGSDAGVKKSTRDTLYYEVLKFKPVPGDFISLKIVVDNFINVNLNDSSRYLALHLSTSAPADKQGYDEAEARHNYLVVFLESAEQTKLVNYIDLGVTWYFLTHPATEVSDIIYLDPLEINTNRFAISAQFKRYGIDFFDSAALQRIYVLKDDSIITVFEHPCEKGVTSGTRDTESFIMELTKYAINPMKTSTNGLFDISLKYRTEKWWSTNHYDAQEMTWTCQWDGQKYIQDPVPDWKKRLKHNP